MEPTASAAIGAVVKTAGYAKTANAFWKRLQPTLRAKIKVKVEKHFRSFSDYLNATDAKTSTVQLICSRSINSQLDDVYIPCNFKIVGGAKNTTADNDLISDIRDGKRMVVRGNGGSGKTLFMKKLWKTVYNEPNGKIPVFIELRKFNEMKDVDILTLLRYTLSAGSDLTLELFHELANDGSFLLIFDGFDEVSVEKRLAVERQLIEFEHNYKKCSIIVSSRPNETFIGWKAFHIYDVVPFNRKQVLELIDKTPIDKSWRSRFKTHLTQKFFDKHEEFLCSPLLALMMFVTFKQKGDISDNLIEFYDNAFHALYSEHDAIKEAYKRPHCLSINEFRLVFSTFCMFTYYKEKFELREADIREFIQKSLDHVNLTRDGGAKIDCSIEDILHEFTDAVNLMRKDGISYLFVHRSFQEFFAAYWVMVVDSKRTERLLEDLALRPGDNVLGLAYQMNKVKVEESYVLPMHERLLGAGAIFKSKPSGVRWPYVEGYDLVLSWRLVFQDKDGKKIPKLIPRWKHGQAGLYYANMDNLIFEGRLQDKFTKCLREQFEAARPSRFARDCASKDCNRYKLSFRLDGGEIIALMHKPGNGAPENVTQSYLTEDDKYRAKIEAAFETINIMLHDLNKTVNAHVNAIKDGHTKSEKNLDDMFF